jgi:hypothetical protein
MMIRNTWLALAVAFIAVTFLCTGCGAGDEGQPGVAGAPTITSALERTARYFDDRPLRGDVSFLIAQASKRLSPDFTRWSSGLKPDEAVTRAMENPTSLQYIEAIMWQERGRAHRQWQSQLPPAVAATPVAPALNDQEVESIAQVMALGLTCKELSAQQRGTWLSMLATPSRSYLLTHQLLSLTWGRDSGCLNDAEADPLRVTLATALYQELLGDGVTVNDLSLERMAMLCFADLCNWVSEAQTNAVVTKQLENGSWGDGSVPVHPRASVSEEHTAGLGFFVLAMKWDWANQPPRPPR